MAMVVMAPAVLTTSTAPATGSGDGAQARLGLVLTYSASIAGIFLFSDELLAPMVMPGEALRYDGDCWP